MVESLRMVERTYQFGFERYPEGAWEVGGEGYRPFWPRGLPEGWIDEEVRNLVSRATRVLAEGYNENKELPKDVRVQGSSDGVITYNI